MTADVLLPIVQNISRQYTIYVYRDTTRIWRPWWATVGRGTLSVHEEHPETWSGSITPTFWSSPTEGDLIRSITRWIVKDMLLRGDIRPPLIRIQHA